MLIFLVMAASATFNLSRINDAVEFAKSLGNSFLSLHCFRTFKKLEKSKGGVWQLVAEYNQDGSAKH